MNKLDIKQKQKERQNEITALIDQHGISNISPTELSKKFEVSRKTIYEDLKDIGRTISGETWQDIDSKISLIYKRCLQVLETLLEHPDSRIKLGATASLINALKEFERFYRMFHEPLQEKEIEFTILNSTVDLDNFLHWSQAKRQHDPAYANIGKMIIEFQRFKRGSDWGFDKPISFVEFKRFMSEDGEIVTKETKGKKEKKKEDDIPEFDVLELVDKNEIS